MQQFYLLGLNLDSCSGATRTCACSSCRASQQQSSHCHVRCAVVEGACRQATCWIRRAALPPATRAARSPRIGSRGSPCTASDAGAAARDEAPRHVPRRALRGHPGRMCSARRGRRPGRCAPDGSGPCQPLLDRYANRLSGPYTGVTPTTRSRLASCFKIFACGDESRSRRCPASPLAATVRSPPRCLRRLRVYVI
jgi:hypothetical protein